ncbi:hypothetical protein EV360DRAFT_54542, partial [Lentinula raphanica]
VVDKCGRVIAVLAGKPRDPKWDKLMKDLEDLVRAARRKMTFSEKQKNNKRVSGPSVSLGTSFGGGSQRPGTMAFYGISNRDILINLTASPSFQRLVGFTNCKFPLRFSADLLGFVTRRSRYLCAQVMTGHRSDLENYFIGTGPGNLQVLSNYLQVYLDLQVRYLPLLLGRFDPDKGGRLVLWDLGLIVRLPPGSTILIPSALLTHSNLPIQDGEERYSVVQYSSSGLFRWVYNGFMSDKDFLETKKPVDIKKRAKDRKARWGNGLKMFSLWNDIQSSRST